MCTSLQQKKEPNLQATRRDKINYSNKMKKQEEIECSNIFGFTMSIHQYKIDVNEIEISKEPNTKPGKICECVSDVFSKHVLEERVPLEERNEIFPILKLWWYIMY
jgi:hypothetical protein